MDRISPQLRALCWAWIVLCGAYLAYGYTTYSGLYRWLAGLQVSLNGKYFIALTGIVPFLLLAAPALFLLRRDYLAAQRDGGGRRLSNAGKARAARRSAVVMIAISAVCFILSGATFLIGQSKAVPAGDPVPVDLSSLGTAPLPEGRVTVSGRVLADRGVTTMTEARWQTFENFYAPMIANEEPARPSAYRVFVKRSTARSGNQPALRQMFLGTETGILIPGGLPAEVRAILAQQGVQIAEPHWLLGPPSAANDNYYAAAAAAGLIGLILFLGGSFAFYRARVPG